VDTIRGKVKITACKKHEHCDSTDLDFVDFEKIIARETQMSENATAIPLAM